MTEKGSQKLGNNKRLCLKVPQIDYPNQFETHGLLLGYDPNVRSGTTRLCT
jgi:hypothetical protein